MADPTKPQREAAWLTKQAMADALDTTVNYFDREVRRYAKPDHIRRDGKRLLFYARGVLDAWYTARIRPPQESVYFDSLSLEMMLLGMDPLDGET